MLLLKPNATVIQMPEQLQMMYHHLYHIKAQTIIVRQIAIIMMIHGYLKHLRKLTVPTILVIQSPPQPHYVNPRCIHLERI